MKSAQVTLLVVAMLTGMLGSACKKCQTCTISYSYEYTDTDPNGDPITVTETGTEVSDEECSSGKNLDDMEQQWKDDASALETQLEGQGATNIAVSHSCPRE